MAIIFDTTRKLIILDVTSITAKELYSRWCDWLVVDDNIKYLPVFKATGGDDLGEGLLIPPYYFLINGWRIKPMEANHLLVIDGNIFVDGGGNPIVQTDGVFNIVTKLIVPVQAQGISTSGSTGPSADEIATAIWNKQVSQSITPGTFGHYIQKKLLSIGTFLGLK